MAIPFKTGIVTDHINSGKSIKTVYRAIATSGLNWDYESGFDSYSNSYNFTSDNDYIHTDGWQFNLLTKDMFVGQWTHARDGNKNFTLEKTNITSLTITTIDNTQYLDLTVTNVTTPDGTSIHRLLTPIYLWLDDGYGVLQGSWKYNGYELLTSADLKTENLQRVHVGYFQLRAWYNNFGYAPNDNSFYANGHTWFENAQDMVILSDSIQFTNMYASIKIEYQDANYNYDIKDGAQLTFSPASANIWTVKHIVLTCYESDVPDIFVDLELTWKTS